MGLDGDICVLNPVDRNVLVDLAFEETKKMKGRGEYKMGSREKIAYSLKSAFKLCNFDLSDIFIHMDTKYEKALIKLGVFFKNPLYPVN